MLNRHSHKKHRNHWGSLQYVWTYSGTQVLLELRRPRFNGRVESFQIVSFINDVSGVNALYSTTNLFVCAGSLKFRTGSVKCTRYGLDTNISTKLSLKQGTDIEAKMSKQDIRLSICLHIWRRKQRKSVCQNFPRLDKSETKPETHRATNLGH